jgi:hypothetical protein
LISPPVRLVAYRLRFGLDWASSRTLNKEKMGNALGKYRSGKSLIESSQKKLNAPYQSGPSRTWIKVKNPKAPAVTRAIDGTF